MSKTFTTPFARGNFNLRSTSKESGRAALALTLNNLDVPNFFLLIYPQEKREAGEDHVCGPGRHISDSSPCVTDEMKKQQDQGHLPCCLLTADVALITEPMQFPLLTLAMVHWEVSFVTVITFQISKTSIFSWAFLQCLVQVYRKLMVSMVIQDGGPRCLNMKVDSCTLIY